MGGTLHNADAVLLVVDLADPACVDQISAIRERLEEKKVSLVERALPHASPPAPGADDSAVDDPFRVHRPAVLLANKADRLADAEAELEVFRQLASVPFASLAVSAQTGHNLAAIGPTLFDVLGIVRIYSKVPGHSADMGRPFTLRRGGTVREVALQVHRGLASELKFARIWGPSAEFEGQQVSADHVVQDRDVVELHW
jgi:ribosome-interacting GTPase 1